MIHNNIQVSFGRISAQTKSLISLQILKDPDEYRLSNDTIFRQYYIGNCHVRLFNLAFNVSLEQKCFQNSHYTRLEGLEEVLFYRGEAMRAIHPPSLRNHSDVYLARLIWGWVERGWNEVGTRAPLCMGTWPV